MGAHEKRCVALKTPEVIHAAEQHVIALRKAAR